MHVKLFITAVISSLLFGCSTGGPKETGGTYIGAATGAIIGSQFGKGSGRLIGTALGTFIGAQVGGSVGRQMDARDRQLAGNTAYRALESQPDNKTVSWRNPNNNHSGSVVVTNTRESSTTVCRDYVQTIYIDGQSEKMTGYACRDLRDTRGIWRAQ